MPAACDQRWFWSDRWQRLEHEADADIAGGRVACFADAEELLEELDSGE